MKPGAVSREGWILVGAPLLLSPWLLGSGSDELSQPATRCAASTLLMAVLWATEALPLAVTALLPFALFPLLGIRSSSDTAATFFTDTQFLNLGGQMIAAAIEGQNLHTRIALRVLLVVGTAPRRLLLGFMLACAFLSMWMSNTATAGMMMPIARTLLATISSRSSGADVEAVRRYRQGVLLGVAYGCSVGGIATLTGTPANIILAGFISEQYPEFGDVSFTAWFVTMLPLALLLIVGVWAILCCTFVDASRLQPVGRHVLTREYSALGEPQFGEKLIGYHFIVLIVLWLSRAPPPPLIGWGAAFTPGYISDSTAAMVVRQTPF
jgi:sodium-dependent dicarboxylate transporter 2/3/5